MASQEEKSQAPASQEEQPNRKRSKPASSTQPLASVASPPKKPRSAASRANEAASEEHRPTVVKPKTAATPKGKPSQASAIQQGLAHKKTFATLQQSRLKLKKKNDAPEDPALASIAQLGAQMFQELSNSDGEQQRDSGMDDIDEGQVKETRPVPSWAPGGTNPDPILQTTFKMMADARAAEEAKEMATAEEARQAKKASVEGS